MENLSLSPRDGEGDFFPRGPVGTASDKDRGEKLRRAVPRILRRSGSACCTVAGRVGNRRKMERRGKPPHSIYRMPSTVLYSCGRMRMVPLKDVSSTVALPAL
jgi:hypothetical protein